MHGEAASVVGGKRRFCLAISVAQADFAAANKYRISDFMIFISGYIIIWRKYKETEVKISND